METLPEPSSNPQINAPDSPKTATPTRDHDHHLQIELEALRHSYQTLQSQSSSMEETLIALQRQRDDLIDKNSNFSRIIEGLSAERDGLYKKIEELEGMLREKEEECLFRNEENWKEREGLRVEIEVYKGKFQTLEKEREKRSGFLLNCSGSIWTVNEALGRIIACLDEDKATETEAESESGDLEFMVDDVDDDMGALWRGIEKVKKLAGVVESRVVDYKETRKKERKQFENSVVSLTEENRDINTLLRVALVEKEALEKNLNKFKGNSEQKRVPLLHFARAGFGFMMGSGGSGEQPVVQLESSAASSTGSKSDGSECEEEVVSLASTVEKIMKNLRLEITQLRRSLEESRSDTERLQSLTSKQAQEIAECKLYISELEERESLLAQNAEELLAEIKETEAEVARWREACELEVEAGKNEIEERDKVVIILQQELEKTKVALDIANGKLKLKEELASTAMAAQAAAERSLQLADSRSAELRERIEELTNQLEEAESRERRGRRGVARICWPFGLFKLNPVNNARSRFPNVKRMLPEMQALLHGKND